MITHIPHMETVITRRSTSFGGQAAMMASVSECLTY